MISDSQSVEKIISLVIMVSTMKMQYFEYIKKQEGFRFCKDHPDVIKDTINNMDNDVFFTLDQIDTLRINDIKYDDNKIANAFKIELEKRYPNSYKQIF